jgi:hypothetical protein
MVAVAYLILLMSGGDGLANMRFVIEVNPGVKCSVQPNCTVAVFGIHTQDENVKFIQESL